MIKKTKSVVEQKTKLEQSKTKLQQKIVKLDEKIKSLKNSKSELLEKFEQLKFKFERKIVRLDNKINILVQSKLSLQQDHEDLKNKFAEMIKQLDAKINVPAITSQQQLLNVVNLIKQWKILQVKFMLLDEKTQLFRERLNKIYKVNTYKKLSPSELYDYVNFIENNKNAMHLGFFHIQIYCNERAKYLILNAKLKFYTNTESNTKINMVEKNKIISKLKYAIASSNSYIKNLRPSLYGKYHAKVVLFLENCKKNEPANFSNPNAVISLRDVSKYYVNKFNAFKVLKNVDLEINNGEFVVILGPSGSGKTTLLNIISGMDNATYGEVIVAGESLINKRDSALTSFRKRNVGYVFQQYGLLPNLNVRENVEIGANLQKNDSKKIDIDELLKVLGIFDFRKKLPYELSGGQQQRVSIARSLAKNPNVLFGDEPTGAIDEKNTKEILTLFKKTNKKYKTTIIIVTHNNLIAEMADTVIKFNDGKVSQILHNPNPKTVEEINW